MADDLLDHFHLFINLPGPVQRVTIYKGKLYFFVLMSYIPTMQLQ